MDPRAGCCGSDVGHQCGTREDSCIVPPTSLHLLVLSQLSVTQTHHTKLCPSSSNKHMTHSPAMVATKGKGQERSWASLQRFLSAGLGWTENPRNLPAILSAKCTLSTTVSASKRVSGIQRLNLTPSLGQGTSR